MKNSIKPSHFVLALVLGALTGLIFSDTTLGIAVFVITLVITWAPIYIEYANDNPKNLWFKRKLYGWGWTPVTKEGWLVIAAFLVLLVWDFNRINSGSPSDYYTMVNFLPDALILTAVLIIICYKKGEKPRWQWGNTKK